MKFSNPPKVMSYKKFIDKDFCLAPSKYSSLMNLESDKISLEPLDSISDISREREKLEMGEIYYYVEIGDIDVENGDLNYQEKIGFEVPSKSPLKLKKGDIIISTVRTYRKGISYIQQEGKIICTPALMVIRNVDKGITKEYLYSILRSDFFVEQILSLQNRGMYPRLDKDTKKEVLVPKPNDKKIIEYVTELTKSLMRKEYRLKELFYKINRLIEKELENNSKKIKKIKKPTYEELIEGGRIDTGIYNKNYKSLINIIENYTGGYFFISKELIKSGSTPKERIIGDGIKNWVTPTSISEKGLIIGNEKIVCEEQNIEGDCVLITNRTSKEGRGEYVGISMYYDFSKNGSAQHNQGCYRIDDMEKEEMFIITMLLNSGIYRKICGNISMGSKMKEIKSKDFSKIPFPKLNKEFKEKLVNLYSSEERFPLSKDVNINNFEKIDKISIDKLGFLELSIEIKKTNMRIEKVIEKIVLGHELNLDFEFLK